MSVKVLREMEGKRNRYYEQTFVKAVIPIALRRSWLETLSSVTKRDTNKIAMLLGSGPLRALHWRGKRGTE